MESGCARAARTRPDKALPQEGSLAVSAKWTSTAIRWGWGDSWLTGGTVVGPKGPCSLKGIRHGDARADLAARVPLSVQFQRNRPPDSEAAPVPAGGNRLCRA